MYLNIFDKDLVVSAAVQSLKSGEVVAHVFDSKPRSYEDCVRYGLPHYYSSLSQLIDYHVKAYGKVTYFCSFLAFRLLRVSLSVSVSKVVLRFCGMIPSALLMRNFQTS